MSAAAELGGFFQALNRDLARVLDDTARTARQRHAEAARRAGGGLSRMGPAGARLDVAVTRTDGGRGVSVTPVGPWGLVEHGHRGGYTTPARRRRQGGGPPRIRVGGRWVTGPVTVGRSRGRPTWQPAAADVVDGFAADVEHAADTAPW